MIIYLIRHGQDDTSVRGGWSSCPLTDKGIAQSKELAEELLDNKEKYNIQKIYSSDLKRAKQTAEILSRSLHLNVTFIPQFREVNNGYLAGIKNEEAETKYPGLYWKNLKWNQEYPGGESPKAFYHRVKNGWEEMKRVCKKQNGNIALVTHGGVIHIIYCLENGMVYSNKNNYPPVKCSDIIPVFIE